MLKIIESKKEWAAVLNCIKTYDFYHTYDYHHLSKNQDETPILIQYSIGETIIAMPLLVRPIENSFYKDATSVYGYAGPISKNITTDFNTQEFHLELKVFLLENNIITIFSRLNPFINNQEFILSGLGEIANIGKVVNIDLTLSLEIQKTAYNKTLRRHLNKTKNLCSVRSVENEKEVLEFIEIYIKTMSRINADYYYFFDKAYFFNMLCSSDFKTDLLVCVDNETNEVLAGVLFVTTNNIVQYHLSASKERYQHLHPTKLIIDKMRILSSEQGCISLNLGGGIGNADDSLFRFKASFSNNNKSFSIWRWVINKTVNQELITRHEKYNSSEFNEQSTNYFPIYRIKI